MRPARKLKLQPVLARRQRQHGLRLPAAEMHVFGVHHDRLLQLIRRESGVDQQMEVSFDVPELRITAVPLPIGSPPAASAARSKAIPRRQPTSSSSSRMSADNPPRGPGHAEPGTLALWPKRCSLHDRLTRRLWSEFSGPLHQRLSGPRPNICMNRDPQNLAPAVWCHLFYDPHRSGGKNSQSSHRYSTQIKRRASRKLAF